MQSANYQSSMNGLHNNIDSPNHIALPSSPNASDRARQKQMVGWVQAKKHILTIMANVQC